MFIWLPVEGCTYIIISSSSSRESTYILKTHSCHYRPNTVIGDGTYSFRVRSITCERHHHSKRGRKTMTKLPYMDKVVPMYDVDRFGNKSGNFMTKDFHSFDACQLVKSRKTSQL